MARFLKKSNPRGWRRGRPTVPESVQYETDLSQEPLPAMLAKVYRHRVPGVITASRDEVKKSLYVKDGNVIYARSSDRHDSLGAHLLRQHLVTPEALTQIAKERETNPKPVGVLLMEKGLLSPKELNQAIRQQTEAIAFSLFTWQDGQVKFDLHELNEQTSIRIQISLRDMILHGVKQAPDPKRLVALLGSKQTVFEPCYQGEEIIDIGLDKEEYELLQRIDGKTTLLDVCNQGPLSPADNAKLLYAFRVLKLIQPVRDGAVKIRLLTESNAF
jgi:hypothetical protein